MFLQFSALFFFIPCSSQFLVDLVNKTFSHLIYSTESKYLTILIFHMITKHHWRFCNRLGWMKVWKCANFYSEFYLKRRVRLFLGCQQPKNSVRINLHLLFYHLHNFPKILYLPVAPIKVFFFTTATESWFFIGLSSFVRKAESIL